VGIQEPIVTIALLFAVSTLVSVSECRSSYSTAGCV